MRAGDIVRLIGSNQERRVVRLDRHVLPIVLDGLVGCRFAENDVQLVRTKIEENRLKLYNTYEHDVNIDINPNTYISSLCGLHSEEIWGPI